MLGKSACVVTNYIVRVVTDSNQTDLHLTKVSWSSKESVPNKRSALIGEHCLVMHKYSSYLYSCVMRSSPCCLEICFVQGTTTPSKKK